jgi:hypothetical protein
MFILKMGFPFFVFCFFVRNQAQLPYFVVSAILFSTQIVLTQLVPNIILLKTTVSLSFYSIKVICELESSIQ